MKPLATWVVAGVVAAMGAAGRQVAGGTDTGSRECGSVRRVGSLSALAALAPKDWLNGTAPETITSDITSTVALNVDLQDLVPKGTQLRSLGIDIRGVVPGVSRGPVGSGTVSIRPGATFRIRFAMRPFLPISSSVPRVTFEAPCRAACGSGERRCAEDDICYAAGGEYCKECSRESPERCACVAPDGSDQPDGTSCSYVLRGSDLGTGGECRAGMCGPRPR
jgi:hypothetical protein